MKHKKLNVKIIKILHRNQPITLPTVELTVS